MPFELWLKWRRLVRWTSEVRLVVRRIPVLDALLNMLLLLVIGGLIIGCVFSMLPKEGYVTYAISEWEEMELYGLINTSISNIKNGSDSFHFQDRDASFEMRFSCASIVFEDGRIVQVDHEEWVSAKAEFINSFIYDIAFDVTNNAAPIRYSFFHRGKQEIKDQWGDISVLACADGKLSWYLSSDEPFELTAYFWDASLVIGDEEHQTKDQWQVKIQSKAVFDESNVVEDENNVEHVIDMTLYGRVECSAFIDKGTLDDVSAWLDYFATRKASGSLIYTVGIPQSNSLETYMQDAIFKGKRRESFQLMKDSEDSRLILAGYARNVYLSGKSILPNFGTWLYNNYSVIAASVATSALGGVLLAKRRKN